MPFDTHAHTRAHAFGFLLPLSIKFLLDRNFAGNYETFESFVRVRNCVFVISYIDKQRFTLYEFNLVKLTSPIAPIAGSFDKLSFFFHETPSV